MIISHSEMDAKRSARAKFRTARRQIAPDRARDWSRRAQNKLMENPLWLNARELALFVSLPEEISTRRLLASAWGAQKKVWLPRIRKGQSGRMDFSLCAAQDNLERSEFGLMEPTHGPWSSQYDLGTKFRPDLVLVPGLAFDSSGVRLGYGGGYYDRFFAAYTGTLVGFCFSSQLAEMLPHDEWDVKMAYICTELGVSRL